MKENYFGITLVPVNRSRFGYYGDKLIFAEEYGFEEFDVFNNYKHRPMLIVVYNKTEINDVHEYVAKNKYVLRSNLVGCNFTIEEGLVRSPSKYYEIIATSDESYRFPTIDNKSIELMVNSNFDFEYSNGIIFSGKIAQLEIKPRYLDVDEMIEYLANQYEIPLKYLTNKNDDNREIGSRFISEMKELINKHNSEINKLIKKYEINE